MLLLAAIGFVVSGWVAIVEAISERDWPRETIWFPLGFALALILTH